MPMFDKKTIISRYYMDFEDLDKNKEEKDNPYLPEDYKKILEKNNDKIK